MTRRALILGGAGFIGSHLAAALRADAQDVQIVDVDAALQKLDRSPDPCDRYRSSLLRDIRRCAGDVADRDGLGTTLRQLRPTVIYYLAALPLVKQAEADFALASDSMIRGLCNALEAARGASTTTRFVYVSSSMVYGDFAEDPLPEAAATNPLTLYGRFKLVGEHLVRAYLGSSAIDSVIVRPCAVYGPGDPHPRVVRKFCRAAVSDETIEVTSPGDTIIDFTWIEDLITGLMLAGSHPCASRETFNMTRGAGRSLANLVEIVRTLAPGVRVRCGNTTDPLRPRRGALDISKARALLGYEPRVDLEQGVARYIDHLRQSLPAPSPDFAEARA